MDYRQRENAPCEGVAVDVVLITKAKLYLACMTKESLTGIDGALAT